MYTKEEKEKFKQEIKLRIYQWTIRLTKYLRELSKRKEKIIWIIVDQLMRSGSSTGANYIEAIGAPTTADFRNFLAYSLKSCNESKYWLALLHDSEIDKGEESKWLLREAIELANILGKSVSTLYKR